MKCTTMGCIVYSSAISDFKHKKLVDPVLDDLFLKASNYVLEHTGNVDKGLRLGHLLSNLTVRMLDKATGEDCFLEGK